MQNGKKSGFPQFSPRRHLTNKSISAVCSKCVKAFLRIEGDNGNANVWFYVFNTIPLRTKQIIKTKCDIITLTSVVSYTRYGFDHNDCSVYVHLARAVSHITARSYRRFLYFYITTRPNPCLVLMEMQLYNAPPWTTHTSIFVAPSDSGISFWHLNGTLYEVLL